MMLARSMTSGVAAFKPAGFRPAMSVRVCQMRPSQSNSSFLGGSFSGHTLAQPAPGRGALQVVAGKAGGSMGCTKKGTRRKRTNVSGYRARMATPGGAKVISRRRKRGRKVLCPANNKRSGGK